MGVSSVICLLPVGRQARGMGYGRSYRRTEGSWAIIDKGSPGWPWDDPSGPLLRVLVSGGSHGPPPFGGLPKGWKNTASVYENRPGRPQAAHLTGGHYILMARRRITQHVRAGSTANIGFNRYNVARPRMGEDALEVRKGPTHRHRQRQGKGRLQVDRTPMVGPTGRRSMFLCCFFSASKRRQGKKGIGTNDDDLRSIFRERASSRTGRDRLRRSMNWQTAHPRHCSSAQRSKAARPGPGARPGWRNHRRKTAPEPTEQAATHHGRCLAVGKTPLPWCAFQFERCAPGKAEGPEGERAARRAPTAADFGWPRVGCRPGNHRQHDHTVFSQNGRAASPRRSGGSAPRKIAAPHSSASS